MTTTYAPSPKQLAFIASLAAERGVEAPVVTTSKEASAAITALLETPRPQPVTATEGYYRRGDDYIVIVPTKDGLRRYAKVLTEVGVTASGARKFKWQYAPGVAASLAGDTPVTLEEAAKWSHLHGVCLRCGRALKDPKAVGAGLGKICAGYFA